ncbi:MAG: molecular chaperone HtpG, partial [Gammaproteobacteria bacterium]|nr:molecular chaperone HtpG [Gammaproteobacteria bacterium]
MSQNAHSEKYRFQTEDRRLLDLVIHSLYSEKDIFLRELIANAADAISKAKYMRLQHPELSINPEFEVVIKCDPKNRCLVISDNGIGMSKQELIDHLGVIARSGTHDFLKDKNSSSEQSLNELIGQFGVGFYSVFMVASSVDVISRSIHSDEAWQFHSDGQGEFSISASERKTHGTTIIAHMKDDEYLHPYRIKHIVEKYSYYAPVSVYLESEEQKHHDEDSSEIESESTENVSWKKEKINETQPLWLRSKNNIEEAEYISFYKEVGKDYKDPLSWLHGKIEGSSDYTFLLYIPKDISLMAWQYQEKPSRVKLHVKHIFITDDSLLLLPRYLSFISGIVDFQDLPLNVSRELLQEHKTIERAKTALTKKVLSHLEDMSTKETEKYNEFWSHFGQIFKMFPAEDPQLKEPILPLLRFPSTVTGKGHWTSLSEYVSRMQPEQKVIYYITASTWDAAMNSPHMDYFKKKGIEVLLLTDRVDESLMNYLHAFEEKELKSITLAELDTLSNNDTQTEDDKNDWSDCCAALKHKLEGKVKDVKISSRLVDSPCCLVVDHSI